MIVKGKFVYISSLLTVVFLLGIFTCPVNHTALAITDGPLMNLGFEQGLYSWNTVINPPPDAAVVVGSEGPADFLTYTHKYMDVTIKPNTGSKMLRLGTPKIVSENQQRGENGVYQEFVADSESLKFAFRLFSWEHRGYDIIRINLTDEWGNLAGELNPIPSDPMLISTGNDDVLWEVTIDVGDRGQFLDSGWTEVEITGLTIGHTYTLSYSVEATDNNAHATWAYFDNVNTPPVAKFTFSPLHPFEGEIVELLDLSYDPDPGDVITSWQWNIEWDTGDETKIMSSNAQFPYFIPPDNKESYSVSLTVTDSYDESDTAQTGEYSTDGFLLEPEDNLPVPELIVENMAPKVNALNTEVLAGDDATFIGRFLDTGWLDTHTVDWDLGGIEPIAVDYDEDNLAFVDTGITTAQVNNVNNSFSGTLTVTDIDGASSSDSFDVTVVQDDPLRYENNDTPDNATPLTPDGIYLSYLQDANDIDWYKLDLSGDALSTGDEVLVTLKDLPADYDLVLLSEYPEDMQPAGYSWFGYSWFGYSWFGYSWFGYSWFGYSWFGYSWFGVPETGFSRPPFQGGPFQISNYLQSGYSWFGYSWFPFDQLGYSWFGLSQVGYTGLEGDDIGGSDISLEEIGLGSLEGEGLNVASFSANRGLEDEVLLYRCEVPGTNVYIGVLGQNDAHSSEPYLLQIEMSEALDLTQLLDELPEELDYEPPVDDYTDGDYVLYDVSDQGKDPITLFVTQEQRLRGLYGDTEFNGLLTDLSSLADIPDINGRIISVPIHIYADWDSHYDDVSAANEVTVDIRDYIQQELEDYPTIEYVVLVGDDDIIPYRRVPDETTIGNEKTYAMSSFLRLGSPLFFSFWEGYVLSDDYFVDAIATPWQGRLLYIPDLPISRLVETPQEIRAIANAYMDTYNDEDINNDGVLDRETALVTGYDFFTDGTQAISDTASTACLATDTLINDTWSAEDLELHLASGYDINSVNAHYSHYAALSANGFATEDWEDVLVSDDIVSMADVLENRAVFSMGCHAGLNVPDRASLDAIDIGLEVNPSLDMVQALAKKRAIYIASTGYGYGDDEGIGGTERLAGIFAEELLLKDDVTTVGQALVSAKQKYLTSLSAMTVYDEKSSIEFTLYGLPQYRVEPKPNSCTLIMQNQGTSTPWGSLELELFVGEDPNPYTYTYPLERWDTDSGSYFTADGDAQATAGRAMQPRVVLDMAAYSDDIAHGVLLLGGEYTDITSSPDSSKGFNPVITRPTNEWELKPEEMQIDFESFWPSELAKINSLETDDGVIQTLVITPGQFRGTGSNTEGEVIGTQRLYTKLTLKLLYSDPEDYEPSVISSIDLRKVDETTVDVTVETSDETTGDSGISRIIVLKIGGGEVTSTDATFSETPDDNRYTVTVTEVSPGDKFVIQVVDGADNIAYASAKGANMYAIEVNAGPDRGYTPGETEVFEATIPDLEDLIPPVFYMWDFGDGTTESGILVLNEDDITELNTFSVEHVYGEDAPLLVTATLKIMDSDGGIGVDDVSLYRWWDPQGDANSLADADLINGYAITDGELVTIGIRVDGEISNDFQYRLRIDSDPGGTLHLRYSGGQVTGLPGLECSIVEYNGFMSELQFTFRLVDAGFSIGDRLWLSAQTQSGVPSAPEKGIIDNMPDEGSVLWILR